MGIGGDPFSASLEELHVPTTGSGIYPRLEKQYSGQMKLTQAQSEADRLHLEIALSQKTLSRCIQFSLKQCTRVGGSCQEIVPSPMGGKQIL